MAWPDIPTQQIISLQQLKDAVDAGYLRPNNKFPAGLNLSEMVSKTNFQYYSSKGLIAGIASNQLVWKGAVTAF